VNKLKENTVKSIITNNMDECYFCGRQKDHIHHCWPGNGKRKLSDKYKMIVPLCYLCHDAVHSSLDRGIKMKKHLMKIAQEKAMQEYDWSEEEFIERFGSSILWEEV